MIFLLSWSDLTLLIGRMHPLLVHFPIGILSLAVFMEFGRIFFNKKELGKAALFSLYAGLVASIFAGLSGYLLSQDGSYSSEMLTPHRWAGIGLLVLNIFAIILKSAQRGKSHDSKFYLFTLITLFAVVLYTGHLGGSLTHGSDFLKIRHTDQVNHGNLSKNFPLTELQRPEEAYLFEDMVQPILRNYCGNCHNPQKRKGGLDLSTYSSILEGGDSGVLDVNSFAESELLRRLEEPESSEDRMPPEGKLQLSSGQLEVLKWWVQEKYSKGVQLKFMDLPISIQTFINKAEAQAHPVFSQGDVKHADETALAALRDKGYGVNEIAAENPFLEVRYKFQQEKSFHEIMNDLNPLVLNIVWLDFSGTTITEADFSQFENLIRLNLSQTNITDPVLESITGLRHLEYLNLHSTPISSNGLEHLSPLSKLENVYLWNTAIHPEEMGRLKQQLPQAEIYFGVADGS